MSHATSEDLKAGWSQVDFTPAEPVPLAGYTHWNERRSNRVRDPLMVRAVALAQGDRRVVVVAYDLLMVFEDLYQGLRSRLVDLGVDLLVHATHTHSSVGGFWNTFLGRRFLGDYRPWMLRHLIDAGERAARGALADLAPAQARATAGVLPGLNGNRRDPAGPRDEELTVLRLVRDGDDAVVFSYPAHPVIVAERDHHAISADFPGETIRRLRQDHGFAMYLQGSLGGVDVLFPQDPSMPADRNLELMCEPLAVATTTLARAAQPVDGPLGFASEEWDAGVPDSRPFFEDQAWRRRLDLPLRLAVNRLTAHVPRRARVSAVRVGRFAVAGFQADLGVGIGLAFKAHARKLGMDCPVAASQTNGYLGYLHLRAEYAKAPPESHRGMAVYENAMNFFGRDTGDRVLEASRRVLDRMA